MLIEILQSNRRRHEEEEEVGGQLLKEMEGTNVKQMYFKLSQTALTFQPVTLQHSRWRERSTFEDL